MSPLSLPFPQDLPPSSAEAYTPVRRTTSSNKSWEVVTGAHEQGEQREGDVDMSMIESRSEDSSVLLESSGVTSEEDDPDLPPLHSPYPIPSFLESQLTVSSPLPSRSPTVPRLLNPTRPPSAARQDSPPERVRHAPYQLANRRLERSRRSTPLHRANLGRRVL
jgi:hypothetical protein